MKKTKINLTPEDFPKEIQPLLKDANVYDSSSSSDAAVYYVDTGYYIKTAPVNALASEAELGRLFHARGLGVEVIDYLSQDRDYLITRGAVGDDLTHHLNEPEMLCEILSSALRRLHGQSVEGVPLSLSYKQCMATAGGDSSGGHYDGFMLMDRFEIRSKDEAWAAIQAGKHLLSADTLIHGDACLPNVIQNEGRFSTFIDFAMSGVGDRHTDLYWAIWSLQYNLKTDAYTDLFLELYGRDRFNEDTLRVIAAFEAFG